MRLLPRANQEHLVRVSPKRTAGAGLIQGVWDQDCDWGPLPWGLRGFKGVLGSLARRESGSLAGLSVNLGWGGASAHADRIRRPAEVPPAGVGLCATRHP